MIKLCKDCTFFIPETSRYAKCGRPKPPVISPVFGPQKAHQPYCDMERMYDRWFGFITTDCGREGYYWNPREKS